jgi:CRISPR system Cascade subunit CasC
MTTTPKYMTVHVLTTLPWHNLNRDDRGMPKTLTQGGVTRGMLSSQSLKRAARLDYELASQDASYRSAGHAYKLVADRMNHIVAASPGAAPLDHEKALKDAKVAIDKLVKKVTEAEEKAQGKPKGKAATPTEPAAATEKDKDTNVWLSDDEVDGLAHALIAELASGKTPTEANSVVGVNGQVASLAIAAFGRMFANAPRQQTNAAIAVSPATTTHQIVFETDYFAVVDDLNEKYAEATKTRGASYLDSANYTTGVYYRAITIDREQLRRSWSSFNDPDATARVRALVRSLICALPSGKKTSTAPYTKPLLVLAEEQTGRCAYEFETPVQPDSDGGYKANSVQAVLDQRADAVAFDPKGFGPATLAGTALADSNLKGIEDLTTGNLETVIDHVIEWLIR